MKTSKFMPVKEPACNLSWLLERDDMESWLKANPQQYLLLTNYCDFQLHEAYKLQCPKAKRSIQQTLHTIYECQLSDPLSAKAKNYTHPLVISIKRQIENKWLEYEINRLPEYDYESGVEGLFSILKKHKAFNHPLFDFLENEAAEVHMDYFFLSDSRLNILFFDILAMMLPGSHLTIRDEICRNLWDEAGRGNEKLTHIRLFNKLLKSRSITISADDIYDWQGYSGSNLFMVGATNRENYYKLIGIMAITEIIDPPLYKKLINGANRLNMDKKYLSYYLEHIDVDVIHAEGWFNNVIEPLIKSYPNARKDIFIGALLRLQTCSDYYDHLLSKMILQ
ncbi:iron-containing redox enzyme family protein [Salmonella enterica]|nr:iron-containing redox enzyme family protein [Salmonella enterica]